MASLRSKLKHAWNAFNGGVEDPFYAPDVSVSYGSAKPDRNRLIFSNERTIVSSIFTRISVDVALNPIRHVRLDDQKRYLEDIPSNINDCLTWSPNLDQAPGDFIQDIVLTMFDKGVAAVVPVDTTLNPNFSGGYDVKNMRVGEIKTWYPDSVSVWLYNEKKGRREEILLKKKYVAIIANPFYAVMNEPNSTLQRLIQKLNLLDQVDIQSSSGKLDLLVQLPYTIKSDMRRSQAEKRRKDIEIQLRDSQYGIAYVDATEKVTQLNRPAENNLLAQVEYLTKLLYSQLNITEEVMNGTADEKTMLNYTRRTVGPVMNAIVQGFSKSFLTATGRSQNQAFMAFMDAFMLMPLSVMGDFADKMARNEVMTSNEIRQKMGLKPANDPKADELRNSNMPQPEAQAQITEQTTENQTAEMAVNT